MKVKKRRKKYYKLTSFQKKYLQLIEIENKFLAIIGSLILAPLFIGIVIAIKLEEGIKAPIFFTQKRVGKNQELFDMYKFRTMRVDTPHDMPTHLLTNPEQYITKIGSRMSSKGQKNKNNFNKHPLGVYFLPFSRFFVPIMAIGKYLNL